MRKAEFQEILAKAVAGSSDALEKILNMYMPLIEKHSIINGKLDEDCKQHILLQVISSIYKFRQ